MPSIKDYLRGLSQIRKLGLTPEECDKICNHHKDFNKMLKCMDDNCLDNPPAENEEPAEERLLN